MSKQHHFLAKKLISTAAALAFAAAGLAATVETASAQPHRGGAVHAGRAHVGGGRHFASRGGSRGHRGGYGGGGDGGALAVGILGAIAATAIGAAAANAGYDY